jgi:hypothetical protein
MQALRPPGAVLAIAAVAGLLGCTSSPPSTLPGDRPPAATAASTSGGSGPPSADSAATRAVVRDYLRYWDGVLAAHATRDPDAALLGRYAAGAARARIASAVTTNISRGYFRRGTVQHQPTVVALSDAAATLRDCADISDWVIYSARTRRPVPIGPAEPTRVTTYRLQRRGPGWVVVEAVDGPAC